MPVIPRAFVARRGMHSRSGIFKGLWSTCRTSDLKAPTYKRCTASFKLQGLGSPSAKLSSGARR